MTKTLDINTLEAWLWEAACKIRGENEEAVKNDYNLSPSRYVSQNGGEEILPIEEAIVLLKEAEEERTGADKKLKKILEKMGF